MALSPELGPVAWWIGGAIFGIGAERIHLWLVVRKRSVRDYWLIRRTLDEHTSMLSRIEQALFRREKR